jgi:hypothetical protein
MNILLDENELNSIWRYRSDNNTDRVIISIAEYFRLPYGLKLKDVYEIDSEYSLSATESVILHNIKRDQRKFYNTIHSVSAIASPHRGSITLEEEIESCKSYIKFQSIKPIDTDQIKIIVEKLDKVTDSKIYSENGEMVKYIDSMRDLILDPNPLNIDELLRLRNKLSSKVFDTEKLKDAFCKIANIISSNKEYDSRYNKYNELKSIYGRLNILNNSTLEDLNNKYLS